MKKSHIILYCLFALVFFSCQDETETIKVDADNSFSKTSPITSLISRVSQYETSEDNVLDGTSNCSIQLPVHLTVDGHYLYVVSKSDFQTVQNIKNLSNTDDDKIHFVYPITIIYPNSYHHTVGSESEFESILEGYGDDSPYNDISCIDFHYPISINKYNTNNQVASSVVINGDNGLYNFIENLTAGEIVGFVFPLTLTKTIGSGDNIIVNNNTQLEAAINAAIDECNSTGPTPSDLNTVLTSGSWHVSYFYSDGYDDTNYYNGYNFTFNTSITPDGGPTTAIKVATSINGHWDIHHETSYDRLDLNYDGSVLEELENNWRVLEVSATCIRLKNESGGGSDNHYLNFTKN